MKISPTISYLKIFSTFSCNLKCVHCVHSRISSKVEPAIDSILLKKLKSFVAEAGSLNPRLRIYLSGGEPLLSHRFFQVAHLIKSLGLTYKTMTNGILLEQRYKQLLKAAPESIWITFNGIGERHDAIVGLKGAYEHLCKSVLNSISHLQNANIKVGAVLMINPLTYDKISQDIDELTAFRFDEVVIQHLSFISDAYLEKHRAVYHQKFGAESGFCFGEGNDGSRIDPWLLYQELSRISERNYPFQTIIFPPFYKKADLEDYYGKSPQRWRKHSCPRALKEFWILPDGAVTVCFAHKIGQIDQSFSQILSSEAWLKWKKAFRELSEPLPGCMRCHRLYLT